MIDQIFSDPWTYVAIYLLLLVTGGIPVTRKISEGFPETRDEFGFFMAHFVGIIALLFSPVVIVIKLAYFPFSKLILHIGKLILHEKQLQKPWEDKKVDA